MTAARIDSDWTRRLLVLCITSAVAVSVVYLPQSMLTNLATDLGVAPGAASIIATAVQVGYAVGILFLVPLADRLHPQRQVTVQGIVLAAALLACAFLPQLVSVAIGFLAVGIVANIAQVVIPAATRMSPASRGGATTSALVGSLLVGIFGGRIIASLLVEQIGWRSVVVIFAALVLAVLPFARKALDSPLEFQGTRRSYGRLLLATLALARRSPALVQSAGMQFFAFATFNSLWTVMVLHLTEAPFHWTVLAAGLFGIIGFIAGIVTPFGGRFLDRFGPLRFAGTFLAIMLLAAITIVFDSKLLVLFGISLFLITLASQSIQSASQSRALAANPGAAAQANTLFMFFVFLGGSVGALLGPIAFAAGGMTRVAEQATVFVVLGAFVWLGAVLWERRMIARTATA
jgi:predicted MFS family arabinose efflux permease